MTLLTGDLMMQYRSTLLLLLLVLAACDNEPENNTSSLEGSSWQLVAIHGMNDSIYAPENPSDYTLRFRSESRLVVDSHCNSAGATWVQNEDLLEFQQFITTRALCPPPTLHNRFISAIISVNRFVRQGDSLRLETAIPGSALEFEPLVFNGPG